MREKMNIDSTALDLGCCSCVTSVVCIGFEKREEVITEIHFPPSIFDTGCRNRIVCSALQTRTFELSTTGCISIHPETILSIFRSNSVRYFWHNNQFSYPEMQPYQR